MAAPSMTGFFNNASNNNFDKCAFTYNLKVSTDLLRAVFERTAPNAILNTGGRADAVRCYPGTRKEVIGHVEKWRKDAQDGTTSNRFFWLSGPAGAGKTAIVQTVAESWQSDDIHVANFFFFRSDASRNHPHSLVSTLLCQILEFYPEARGAVEKVLQSRPRILHASIKEQFNQLICDPLLSIGASPSRPIFLFIDGLDECDLDEKRFQAEILHALDELVSFDGSPFFVLVGSRVEHQISVAFKELRSTVEAIFLDDKYTPEEDIRVFVTAEFGRIKRTHPLAPQDEDWPPTSVVHDIVRRSSGQFVYASTAMRFIFESPSDPQLSLSRVLGVARIITKSPFAHLDAMYTYILSQAEDQEVLKDILGAYTICRTIGIGFFPDLEVILHCYNSNYTDSDIHSCLASIATIARVVDDELTFYHSSLDDYLKTPSRSGQYFCDVNAYMIKIIPALCKAEKGWEISSNCWLSSDCADFLLDNVGLSPSVWSVLLSIDPLNDRHCLLPFLMRDIYDHCVNDDDKAKYKLILRKWIDHCLFVEPNPGLFFQKFRYLPCADGFLEMAEVDHLGDVPSIVSGCFRREVSSETDRRDALQWWFYSIRRRHYPDRLETYKRLMSQWTAWAIANKLTLRAPTTDLPYVQQYYQQAVMTQRGDV